MEKKSIHISIPNPCSENWDKMQPMQDGRHCSNCNKIIYDFSQMSDDELLNFFTESKTIHCGRFHNTQLERTISTIKFTPKLVVSKINKIAAAVFALLSFKHGFATSKNVLLTRNLASKNYFFKPQNDSTTKAKITGVVKDKEGNVLPFIQVQFESFDKTMTDVNGKFSFEINLSEVRSYNIYFVTNEFSPTVRSYHPTMKSTNYEVILTKPSGENWSMGIFLPLSEAIGDLPSLVFKSKDIALSIDNKALLTLVAEKLKNNTKSKISVTAYVEGCRNSVKCHKRVVNVKNYLVNKRGISSDRIITEVIVDGGDGNTVDIKAEQQ